MDKTLNILHSMRILELKNNLNSKATEEAIKEIKELKESCDLHYRLMVSSERRGVDKGILKARKIVAMLFWEWRQAVRVVRHYQQEKFNSVGSMLIIYEREKNFKKAYKMLKEPE